MYHISFSARLIYIQTIFHLFYAFIHNIIYHLLFNNQIYIYIFQIYFFILTVSVGNVYHWHHPIRPRNSDRPYFKWLMAYVLCVCLCGIRWCSCLFTHWLNFVLFSFRFCLFVSIRSWTDDNARCKRTNVEKSPSPGLSTNNGFDWVWLPVEWG